MAIKYHFYKCTVEPDAPYRYYERSTGLCGFLSPQDRENYIGYMTIEDAEAQTPNNNQNTVKNANNNYKRYTNVTRNYNSRY